MANIYKMHQCIQLMLRKSLKYVQRDFVLGKRAFRLKQQGKGSFFSGLLPTWWWGRRSTAKKPQRSRSSQRWSIVIGNLLEHFDSSLYGFLSPLVGKAFFPSFSPFYQIVLAYSVYILTFIARPLGGLVFSQLTYRYSPLRVLSWSLIGLSISTGLLGFIPSATQIGLFAPCLLVLIRFIQSFCAAGESALAGYYLIEKAPQHKQTSWSGIYQSSTVLGILMASSLSGVIFSSTHNENLWRYAFFLGFLLGLWALWLRFQYQKNETKKFTSFVPPEKTIALIKTHWRLILFLVPIYGFSYLTYSFPFVFLNPYLAEITSLSLPDLMKQTSSLLWIDALLLPVIALSFQHLRWRVVLVGCILLFMFAASCLLVQLPSRSSFLIFSMRFLMILGGIGFTVALIPWTASFYPCSHKYFLHSVGYNLGTELFGRSTPAICLWLYALTHHPSSPLLYILPLSFIAIGLVLWFELFHWRNKVSKQHPLETLASQESYAKL